MRRGKTIGYLLASVLAVVSTAFLQGATDGLAQTVLQRTRLGNNTEDITFVPTGPFASHIAILDGHEVLGIPAEGGGESVVRKLFDLRSLPLRGWPRGIAYIESEQLFALVDPGQTSKLFVVDHLGNPRETRTIRYLSGFTPVHLEGMVYLPPDAPVFPDRLLLVAYSPAFEPRIQVLRPDGEVVAEIFPESPVGSSFIAGLAFLAPDRLLVGIDDTIWTLDLFGKIVDGPKTLPEAGSIEGLIQLRNGRVVAVDYSAGTLFFFDESLSRLPEEDRNYKIGLGLSLPRGQAWNTETTEYVTHFLIRFGAPAQRAMAAIAPSLDAARQLTDLTAAGFVRPRGMAYLPDENLIALAHQRVPRAILLYDGSGNPAGEVDLTVLGQPMGVTYIPGRREFAVIVREQPRKIHILTRSGFPVRTIDLTPTGVTVREGGIEFFNPAHPSGGQFMILDASFTTHRALITDFNGNVLGEFNYRTGLGLLTPLDLTAITTGAQAGAFAITDPENSEIVIFRLD